MNSLKYLFIGVVAILIFVLISYGTWQLARAVNYKLSYRSMVQQTIVDMIKPEALKQ